MDDDTQPVATTYDLEAADRLKKVQDWYETDFRGVAVWRKEAVEAYKFRDGDQWTDEDRQKLQDELRPCITMNETAAVIDAVAGLEINNREEITLKPREEKDSAGAEAGTMLVEHIRDYCDAEDEESEAFRDLVTGGVACVETYVDPETMKAAQRRVDPFEMIWPRTRMGRSLQDSPRLMRVREIDREEAERMFPGADPAALDATWVNEADGNEDHQEKPGRAYDGNGGIPDGGLSETVRIVECQWVDEVDEQFLTVTDMASGQSQEMTPEQAQQLAQTNPMAAQALVVEPGSRKKRVVMQGFYGAEELEAGPLPIQGVGFTWKMMTGKYDRDKGVYYGMVRAMKDPQQWSNKWLSQALHILNTSAKNTLFIEENVFENERQAEADLSKPGAVVKLASGGMGKFQWKESQGFPQQFFQLIEYASSMVRRTSGVNPELMGMADSAQAGILEYQRKQAAITTLAPFFNALRKARKDIGRTLLKFAVEYMLPSGEAARIIGQERAAALQAMMAPGWDTYDVVVDESPSSPSVKDRSWAAVQQALPILMPMVQAGQLPPVVMAAMIETMPLPSGLIDKVTQALTAPPDPQMQAQQQEQAEIAKQGAVAKVERDRAAATKDYAQAGKLEMETQLAPLEAAADVAATADNAMARDAGMQMDTGGYGPPMPLQSMPPVQIMPPQPPPPPPQPQGNPQLEQAMVAMAQGIGVMSRDIRSLIAAQAAPKRVVRDEFGQVVGVETVQ